MQEALEDIKAAWESRPAAGLASSDPDEGEHRSLADAEIVKMADEYVADNENLYRDYEEKTLPECVQALEVFRNARMLEQEWQAQVWIFHKFEFQNIGGEARAQIRIAPEV
jgi:hypothetical protein